MWRVSAANAKRTAMGGGASQGPPAVTAEKIKSRPGNPPKIYLIT